MAVSSIHEKMVQAILIWIAERYENEEQLSVAADCIFAEDLPLPPNIDGYIPDVYATGLKNKRTIIGEAKTPKDLETPRSREQIRAFIQHLSNAENPAFIIATPWMSTNSAKAIVKSIMKRTGISNVDTVILEKLPI